MATATLERLEHSVALSPARRGQLRRLLQHLEVWLPREADRLTSAREQARPLERREAEWQRLLELYERLSLALSTVVSARTLSP